MDDSVLSYRLYSRYGAYGQLEDYYKWIEDGYYQGERIGEGRPYEVRVCLIGGVVDNLFPGIVDEWSTIRMDLFIFVEEQDRQNFLLAERFDLNSIYVA